MASWPLLDATKEGDLDAVRELLASHPDDVSRVDQNRATCLHWACMSGHPTVAQLLLKANASPAISDEHGRTPLHCAASSELESHALTQLVSQAAGCTVDTVDTDSNTALHLAALEGSVDVINALAAAGAKIDLVNCDSSTALQLAAIEGHEAAVSSLIEHKAGLDITDAADSTAMHLAAGEGFSDVLQVLLDRKANPEMRDANNWTALMLASASGHAECAVTLKPYVDVAAVDEGGRSALQLAAVEGHLEVVAVLKAQAAPGLIEGLVDEDGDEDSDEVDEALLSMQEEMD